MDLIADTSGNTTNRDNARKQYNQFVWIPVNNMTDFKRTDFENNKPKGIVDNESFNEPYVGEYNGNPLSLTNDATGEYNEYNEMKLSVDKYGGFYIGRYESGKDSAKVVIKKDVNVYNGVKWGMAW